jgi:hypothetical protein
MACSMRLRRGMPEAIYAQTAVVVPELRATHEQWRGEDELTALLEGYMASSAAVGIKHLKSGDLVGGLYLWLQGALLSGPDSPESHPPTLRSHLSIACAQARGLFRGTRLAWRQPW